MIKKITTILLLLASNCYSAPVITSMDSAIVGSGFGTKAQAKPYLYANFNSDVNPSNIGITTTWVEVGNMAYDADEGVQSSGCAKGTVNNGVRTLRVQSNGFSWNDYNQKFYVYRKIKRNFDYGAINFKVFRVWAPGFQQPDFYIQHGENYNAGVEGISVISGYNAGWYSNSNVGVKDVYNIEEIIWRSNSGTDNEDGTITYYTNGNVVFSFPVPASNYWFKPKNDERTMVDLFPVHGVKANHTFSSGENYWADDIYVDNTWQRVMIGNNIQFNSCTKKEIQIPTAWSDTSITITENQGSFTNGERAYLFVIDADGNASNGLAGTWNNGSFVQDVVNPSSQTATITGSGSINNCSIY